MRTGSAGGWPMSSISSTPMPSCSAAACPRSPVSTTACRGCWRPMSSPIASRPGSWRRAMAMPAACAAPPGCGGRRRRIEGALPRLPARLRRGQLRGGGEPLPRLRLAAPHRPCRARRSRHRPYRLRRLLCQRREARQPLPEGQARHRRRRAARRGLGGLLHRPALWRALRHADVQGAGGLPQCRGRLSRHGEIFAGGRGDPRDDARAHAAGGAALHRRGLPRPRRHRRAASRQPGAQPGAPRAGGRAAHRGHRLHRPQLQQIPGQDRLGPRQAPRLRHDRARRGGRLPRPQAGRPDLGRGQGARRPGWRATESPPSPICAAPRRSSSSPATAASAAGSTVSPGARTIAGSTPTAR